MGEDTHDAAVDLRGGAGLGRDDERGRRAVLHEPRLGDVPVDGAVTEERAVDQRQQRELVERVRGPGLPAFVLARSTIM